MLFAAVLVASMVAAFELGVTWERAIRPPTVCCTPLSLGMEVARAYEPVPGLFEVVLGLSPSAGLITGIFGLKLTNLSTGPVDPGTEPTSCAPPSPLSFTKFSTTNCGAPASGWYAVLLFPNGTIASLFGGRAPGAWSPVPIGLDDLMELIVLSADDQVGATLSATGTAPPVYGSVLL